MRSLHALYEAYIAKAEQLERDRKPGDGLFGLGSAPKDDPCHDKFAADLEALLGDMLTREPSSGQVREVLEYIYRIPLAHPEPKTAFWMMKAVHGMTVELAGRLEPGDARILRDMYAKDYPRWDRLPAQKQALAALDRARKGQASK